MQVNVKYTIQQIRDGEEYTGEVTIGGKGVKYTLTCNPSLGYLAEGIGAPTSVEEARKVFTFKLTKDEAPVEMTETDFMFFFGVLGTKILDFYELPQTRDSNSGSLGKLVRGELNDIGVSIGIGMVGSLVLEPDQTGLNLLTHPKFGFELAA